jgi:hypothetical protein
LSKSWIRIIPKCEKLNLEHITSSRTSYLIELTR